MEIVQKPIDLSMLPVAAPDAWFEKHYSTTIRRFKGGGVEVCTKRVDMTARKRRSDRWAVGDPMNITPAERWTLEDEANLESRMASRDPERSEQEQAIREHENIERSLRRAKQNVRWHCKAIGADHMLTFSYRENMQDDDRLKDDWKRFLRLVRNGLPASEKFNRHRGLKHWQFVACRERQERGAWHLHVAVVGRQDINFLRRCWFVAAGGNQDDEGAETVGAANVRGPSKRWGSRTFQWRTEQLAGYMTKYMSKLFEELPKGEKRYWAGRANVKPEVVKVWITANDFYTAIKLTHAAAVANGAEKTNLWASDGWDVVWCSS